MRFLVGLLAALALVGAGAWLSAQMTTSAQDPAVHQLEQEQRRAELQAKIEQASSEAQQRQAAADRARRQQELDAQWDGPRLAAVNIAQIVAILLVPAVLIALAAAGWLALRRHTRLPTPDGRYPLRQVSDADALTLAFRHQEVLLAHATRTEGPDRVHYAPRWDQRVQMRGGDPAGQQAALDGVHSLPAPPPALSLAEIASGPSIVYGIAPDGRRLTDDRGKAGDVPSITIGGQPGMGKSTSLAVYLRQYAARGARLYVGDLHAGSEQSLTARLGAIGRDLPPARRGATPEEVIGLLEAVHAELRRRIRLSNMLDRAGRTLDRQQLLVLAVDEWNGVVLRGGDQVVEKMAEIAREGRKFGVVAILSAQTWTATATGGSELRNPFPYALLHRMRPAEARVLTGAQADQLPKGLLSLPRGRAYLVGEDGLFQPLQVPQLEEAGFEASGEVSLRCPELGQHFDEPEPWTPPGQSRDTSPDTSVDTSRSPHERTIVDSFLADQSVNDIARAIFGVEPGGRAWQDAVNHVQDVLRRALGGDGPA